MLFARNLVHGPKNEFQSVHFSTPSCRCHQLQPTPLCKHADSQQQKIGRTRKISVTEPFTELSVLLFFTMSMSTVEEFRHWRECPICLCRIKAESKSPLKRTPAQNEDGVEEHRGGYGHLFSRTWGAVKSSMGNINAKA